MKELKMTSSLNRKTNVDGPKKPLPVPPQKHALPSSTMGRRINLVSEDKSGNNKKTEKEIKEIATKKFNPSQMISDEPLSEAALAKLPKGAKLVKFESLPEEAQKELGVLLEAYAIAAEKLHRFQEQSAKNEKLAAEIEKLKTDLKAKKASIKAQEASIKAREASIKAQETNVQAKEASVKVKEDVLEKKEVLKQQLQKEKKIEEDKQLENTRNAVKTGLSQSVLRISSELSNSISILCNSVSQANLDKIGFDKGCLTIAEDGMESVLIPFLKSHDTKVVDLTIFKEEIHGNALINLFKALPETQVTKVIIAKVRRAIMTTEELNALLSVKKALASRGFTIALS
jgi:hypothetical protein